MVQTVWARSSARLIAILNRCAGRAQRRKVTIVDLAEALPAASVTAMRSLAGTLMASLSRRRALADSVSVVAFLPPARSAPFAVPIVTGREPKPKRLAVLAFKPTVIL